MKTEKNQAIFYANTLQKPHSSSVTGDYRTLLNEEYYCIHNYDQLDPFFITLVSGSNHWLFLATTGGLSAGRIDADHALFPYYTDDRITENSENTGSKTLLLVSTDEGRLLWEPFSRAYQGLYQLERNLYKNTSGTAVIFEEINHDLGLSFRYAWRSSDTYGFVRSAYLINHQATPVRLEILDGLQNILPAQITTDIQNQFSNLLDAYKTNELHAPSGLAMFSLSSRLTDLAEPSEALRTNTVWHLGLGAVSHLLSSVQVNAFRTGQALQTETKVRGKRGAYFIHKECTIEPNATLNWHLIAEIAQDSASVANLIKFISNDADKLIALLEADIKQSQQNLEAIIASADGLQLSADHLSTAHHFANVLFNVMRGGIFANNYQIELSDLRQYISVHQPALLKTESAFFAGLPPRFSLAELREKLPAISNTDLIRLLYGYLPLTFSRRHGDPSRPWNRFQINVKHADGSQRLDYQGNWRDIFQNWEALSYSYPEFIDGMISVFLNAVTADGYNPYRLTRNGIDWESPEPSNAWANIGYWNDHQIIYLEKLLEVCQQFYPAKLETLLNRRIFSYANVPYKIKPYADLLQNPNNSIEFDWDKEKAIHSLLKEKGADAKLVHTADGAVFHGTLAEKLLLLLLAKLVNFVPEGGIWLNTQRPEWNDANNALVGKGLSVVTLCYVQRYISFCINLFTNSQIEKFTISEDIATLFSAIYEILSQHQAVLNAALNDQQRRSIMDALGEAGSAYRSQYYQVGLSPNFADVSRADLLAFLQLTKTYIEHSLRANKRSDNLYHAYNILTLGKETAQVGHLPVMLEGQVAILSAGLLSPTETLDLLQSLRHSALYREDQHSYILYPNRDLLGFLEKNHIEAAAARESALISTMLARGDARLVTQDLNGAYHFQGDLRNASDLAKLLASLAKEADYTELVSAESERLLEIFETVFNHAAFTGRSGTFFAYEGLGSIYWHMVSKLLLAVQENVLKAAQSDCPETVLSGLLAAYFDVRAGIGFNKTPAVYGAFPTDPYSHTPLGQGAKQPGMTGMVKEEIMTRLVELGIVIEDGSIGFNPRLFRQEELLETASTFHYLDLHGKQKELAVPAGALAFTFCQVPFVISAGSENQFVVTYRDNRVEAIKAKRLPAALSQEIYARTGVIQQISIVFTSPQ